MRRIGRIFVAATALDRKRVREAASNRHSWASRGARMIADVDAAETALPEPEDP